MLKKSYGEKAKLIFLKKLYSCSYLLDVIAIFFFLHSLCNFYRIPLLFIFIFTEGTIQFRIVFYKKHKYFQKQPFAEVPRNRCFAIFTGKHLCWSLFFNNLAEDIVGEIGYCWIFFGKFVSKLTKLHSRIFVMDLAYRYYKYSKATTET